MKKATFAGGCFWCMQPAFDSLPGVARTTVGYTGGKKADPTYEDVCSGTTGHTEAIEVEYDPAVVPYETLVETFWRQIDPTQLNGQFADKGTQYRTGVYFHDDEQKTAALKSRDELAKSGRFEEPIQTEILPAQAFYPAEEYHQKYYQKKSAHYKMYKQGSGRQAYIERTWGPGDHDEH
jgi:peptide methionine sulfoxide reductase msrA/msrB